MTASELDAHYAIARRVAFQVEEQLQELETGRDTSLTFQGNISTNLNQLARELEALEALLTSEHDGARRGAWRKCAPFIKTAPRLSAQSCARASRAAGARTLTRAARARATRARAQEAQAAAGQLSRAARGARKIRHAHVQVRSM